VGGGTLHKSNPRKTFLNFRNGLAMLYKNHPDKGLVGTILTRLILDGIAGVKFVLSGNIQDCMAILKAHFNFYGNISNWRNKRNAIIKTKAVSMIYPKSIVWEYFGKGKKKSSELKQL
jgi:hypothetical protein